MPVQGSIEFNTRGLDQIIARLSPRAEQMAAEEAMLIVRGAMERTVRVKTGTMRRGWHAVQVGRYAWRVGTNVEYALFHEYGTRYMSASPMLRPAVEAVRRIIPRMARELFKL